MAVTADQVVIELEARTDKARRDVQVYVDNFDGNMRRIEQSSGRAENAVVRSVQRQRAAYAQLGPQIQDISLQLASGTNAFIVLAQQGGQTASALSNFGGTVGKVAGFLAGPAGSLLIALTAVAGMFLTSADNAEKAAEKARKNGEAARNLKEAIEDLDNASGRSNKTQQEAIRLSDAATRKFRDEEVAARKLTIARLELARAALVSAQQRSTDPTLVGEGGFNPGAVAAANYAGLIAELDAQLKKQNERIAEASKALIGGEVATSLRNIEGQLDPTTAAVNRYEDAIAALSRQRESGAISQAKFDRDALDLARQRDAAINAAGEARREAAAGRRAERDALREAAQAEREYISIVKDGNRALDDATEAAQRYFDERVKQARELDSRLNPSLEDEAKARIDRDERRFAEKADALADNIQRAEAAAFDLKRDLASGISDAITGADNLGEALERAFQRAAAAAIESRIFEFLSSGKVGDFFKSVGRAISNTPAPSDGGGAPAEGNSSGGNSPPPRASGGHVSAGKLYRVNEGAGRRTEGFQPAGSGKIIPLGRMAVSPNRGVTVLQPLHLDLSGAVVTTELLSQVNGIAQSEASAAADAAVYTSETRRVRGQRRSLRGR